MRNHFLITLLFLVVALFFQSNLNAQCSMCRAVLESEESQEMAKGINNGILYLMAIPYILVAIVGWRVYTIFKKD